MWRLIGSSLEHSNGWLYFECCDLNEKADVTGEDRVDGFQFVADKACIGDEFLNNVTKEPSEPGALSLPALMVSRSG